MIDSVHSPTDSSPRTEVRLGRALRLRCPLCGGAPIFRNWMRFHEHCGSCGWRFEREPGYFLGSIYVNYGVSTALVFGVWCLLAYLLELPTLAALVGTGVFTIVFPLWFLRYARAFWIWLDLSFDRAESDS